MEVKEIKVGLDNVDAHLTDEQLKTLKKIATDARLFYAFLMKLVMYAMYQANADKMDLRVESEPFLGETYVVKIIANRK